MTTIEQKNAQKLVAFRHLLKSYSVDEQAFHDKVSHWLDINGDRCVWGRMYCGLTSKFTPRVFSLEDWSANENSWTKIKMLRREEAGWEKNKVYMLVGYEVLVTEAHTRRYDKHLFWKWLDNQGKIFYDEVSVTEIIPKKNKIHIHAGLLRAI